MAEVDRVIADFRRFVASEITALTFEVHAELVEATPVDLGWARANYVPQLSSPYREDLKDAAPTSGAAASRQSSTEAKLAQIAFSYRVEYGPLFISNNVPYIGRLNDGHSDQAPPGFILLAIDRAVSARKGL